ncbi:hypothetical protein HpHUE40_15400 [Helicobacter pylori]
MRQKKETAKSFNELKAITQSIMLKKGALTNATHQESDRTQEANNANAKAHTQERTQTSDNANISEIASQSALKYNGTSHAKNSALKPTKRAFSERQRTTIRDNSQVSANKSLENKESNHANAFKSDEKNTRGQEPAKKKLNKPLEKADRFEWYLMIAFSLILTTAYALKGLL